MIIQYSTVCQTDLEPLVHENDVSDVIEYNAKKVIFLPRGATLRPPQYSGLFEQTTLLPS